MWLHGCFQLRGRGLHGSAEAPDPDLLLSIPAEVSVGFIFIELLLAFPPPGTPALHVSPFVLPETSSGFHLFETIIAPDLIREWLEDS